MWFYKQRSRIAARAFQLWISRWMCGSYALSLFLVWSPCGYFVTYRKRPPVIVRGRGFATTYQVKKRTEAPKLPQRLMSLWGTNCKLCHELFRSRNLSHAQSLHLHALQCPSHRLDIRKQDVVLFFEWQHLPHIQTLLSVSSSMGRFKSFRSFRFDGRNSTVRTSCISLEWKRLSRN